MRPSDNPFASHRIQALGFNFAVGNDWTCSLERLATMGYRGAIVGPKGNGKTTLLFELEQRLKGLGFEVRLERLRPTGLAAEQDDFVEPSRCARNLKPTEILLLDSAGLLGPLSWRRVRRAAMGAGGIVVTSHQPCWLPTWLECRTTDEQFLSLVEKLAKQPIAEENDLRELLASHRGNVRESFRSLYDRCAGLPG